MPSAALSAALVALSCGPPPWVPDAGMAPLDAGPRDACMGPAGSTTVVLLGGGMSTWRALEDGAHEPYEAGPQGGHHVWVALRARGVRQARTRTTFRAVDESAPGGPLQLVERAVPFVLDAEEGGWCTLTGIRLQLDENPAVTIGSLVGHTLAITVGVEDTDGHAATDTRRVVLDAPAGAADAGTAPDAG